MSVRSGRSHRTVVVAASAVLAGFALVACTSTPQAPKSSGSDATASVPHWSYTGQDGPDRWAGVSPQFATCGTGTRQSPVALTSAPGGTSARDGLTAPVSVEVPDAPVAGTVADTGHTHEFTATASGTAVTAVGNRFDLLQLHHHSPAEHTLNGVRHPVELHLVHADVNGRLLVLSVFVTPGPASAALTPFVDAVAREADTGVALDLAAALTAPAAGGALTYDGSLTTPPCTEGVRWVVLTTPVTMSAGQVDTLAAAHAGNRRPLQPLGSRTVTPATVRVGPRVAPR